MEILIANDIANMLRISKDQVYEMSRKHTMSNTMLRIALLISLLLPVPSVAQAVAKDDIVQAASAIQKAIDGTDQVRLRVNRYCHVTITHEPEEALMKVISVHVLSQKYAIPASEMLYVIRASTAMEGQLLVWSSDCAEVSARKDDVDALKLASEILNFQQTLHRANERFWDVLAQQIGAEERSAIHEQ